MKFQIDQILALKEQVAHLFGFHKDHIPTIKLIRPLGGPSSHPDGCTLWMVKTITGAELEIGECCMEEVRKY